MNEEYDHLEIRCPMLGHLLNFSYCRATDGKTPCRRIFNCWYQRLPIDQFVKNNFPAEVIDHITAPPKPKVLSLIELIEKAQKTKKNGIIPHEDVQR